MASSNQSDAVGRMLSMAHSLLDYSTEGTTTAQFLALVAKHGGRVRIRHDQGIVCDLDGYSGISAELTGDTVDRIDVAFLKLQYIDAEQSIESRQVAQDTFQACVDKVSELLGASSFDGAYGDIGYPSEEIGDRVALWRVDPFSIRLILSNEDSEAPILLILALQREKK